MVLRILADDSASVCRLGLKFGAPLAEVPHLLSTARDLGLSVAGVSYHVGSGNGSVTAFADAVRDARAAFDIAASLGMTLKLLDIGGGFPGSEMGAAPGVDVLPGRDADASNPYASAPSFPAIAGVVRSALDTHFPEGCGVELIAEPGRYFVKSSHVLAVNVIGKKKTVNDDGSARLNYYVNDGLYGSFNCVLYDHVTCTPSLLLTGPASRLAQGAAAGADDDVIAALGPDGRPVVTDALGLGAAVQLTAAAAVAAAGQAAQAQRRVMRVGGGAELEEVEGEGAAGSGLSASGGHSVRPGAHTVVSGVSGARSTASSSSSSGSGSGSASWSYRALERAASTATSAAAPPLIGGSPVSTTVWGPTCDSMDKISDALSLPELAVGDWLVFENMGAYTIAGVLSRGQWAAGRVGRCHRSVRPRFRSGAAFFYSPRNHHLSPFSPVSCRLVQVQRLPPDHEGVHRDLGGNQRDSRGGMRRRPTGVAPRPRVPPPMAVGASLVIFIANNCLKWQIITLDALVTVHNTCTVACS